jgi:nitroreductase
MDVYETVTSRRAVRGFADQPVSREVLERVLSAAAWSPSGSNLQPWNIYVLTGALLAELKTCAVERVANGDPWNERELQDPHLGRHRSSCARFHGFHPWTG